MTLSIEHSDSLSGDIVTVCEEMLHTIVAEWCQANQRPLSDNYLLRLRMAIPQAFIQKIGPRGYEVEIPKIPPSD